MDADKVQLFIKKNNLTPHTIETALIDLYSELGEVSKNVLTSTNYNSKNNPVIDPSELGDVYYSLLQLSIAANIDMSKELDKVLLKYQGRIDDKSWE
jgi:NTP pyrophosphatase (non-canonical NTP hydrolase)